MIQRNIICRIWDPQTPWYTLLFLCATLIAMLIAIDIGRAFRWLWRKILRPFIVCIMGGTLIACAVVILGWGGLR